jgi:hypothetical protein
MLNRLVAVREARRAEPVTVGIPFARGTLVAADSLALCDADGLTRPLQVEVLERWPDQSTRWALVDFQADDDGTSGARAYCLSAEDAQRRRPETSLVLEASDGEVRVASAGLSWHFARGRSFPFGEIVSADGCPPIDHVRSGFELSIDGQAVRFRIARARVIRAGHLRAEIAVDAEPTTARCPVAVRATVECFAGSPVARVAIEVRNPNSATHPGGRWGLGDRASALIDRAALEVVLSAPISGVEASLEAGDRLEPTSLPLVIHQESSGGVHWNSPAHVDRTGHVAPAFCGYRATADRQVREGARATPIVRVDAGDRECAVAVPRFWENFPRALVVRDHTIAAEFWPRMSRPHELLGGEQKTHVVVVAFGKDRISDVPLRWVIHPALYYPPPSYSCATAAIPYLVPMADDPHRDHVGLLKGALDPDAGLLAKRERIDEFGWRHFGDIYADHEAAFAAPGTLFVSHYNNQYDALAGLAIQFIRTSDPRWWELLQDLARHIVDIDIYHTVGDKAAYNGGLFWHTDHYVEAGRSAHRTYPMGGRNGGGPSAEHNYNGGLRLHWLLTGHVRSRETAIDLGAWVLRMDDGRLTPFRLLSRAATGHATFTAGHYLAGRGAGHSVLACLHAHRLSGSPAFLLAAEDVIRRTVHPDQAVPDRFRDDIEGTWSYTVLLQALGQYLDYKIELGQHDDMCVYARLVLLRWAAWMDAQEKPYLDRMDHLEYPNETWVAQDMRKAEVFMWAALHDDGASRERFAANAARYFHYVVSTLRTDPRRFLARPLVVLLTTGVPYAWFAQHLSTVPVRPAGSQPARLPPWRPFVPQKRRAIRHAIALAVACLGALIAAGLWWRFR